jgi:hypothetical protein
VSLDGISTRLLPVAPLNRRHWAGIPLVDESCRLLSARICACRPVLMGASRRIIPEDKVRSPALPQLVRISVQLLTCLDVWRYYRRSDKQRIAEAFKLGKLPPDFVLPPDYNIAPSTFQPVIRPNPESGERELVLMRWGWCRPN